MTGVLRPPAKVTIAIPTYNRAELLLFSLQSLLAQNYHDFHVLVLDNASTDGTANVVHGYDDNRIEYVRNPVNIGLFGNFCRAVKLNRSPYLVVFGDDDVMLPGFITETVRALDEHPSAGFACVHTSYFDMEGQDANGEGARYLSDPVPHGLMEGVTFITHLVGGRKYIPQLSGVLLRASEVARHGNFESTHSYYNLDINMLLRLASSSDVFFSALELVRIRWHHKRDTHRNFVGASGTGRMAIQAELTDAVAYLIRSERASDPHFREWLAARLLWVSAWRSELTAELLPELNLSWSERLAAALREIEPVMPDRCDVILVDGGSFGLESIHGCRARPFLEAPEGGFGGMPADDAQAIEALELMRAQGASRIVFGWPSLWFLEYYAGLTAHLEARYSRLLKTARLTVYDLSRTGLKDEQL